MTTVQTPAAARAAAGLGGQTSIPLGDPQQSHLHLAALSRLGVLLELRIKHDTWWEKIFCETPREAAIHAQRLKSVADVYVGIVPRTGTGRDELLPYANVIWAEADNELALGRALDYTPRAHLVVRSSPGKAHFYWLLNRDIPLEYIVRSNKRLAWHLGCDPASTTKGRILRVAGTRNHKRGNADRVAITRFEAHPNFPARDVVGHLEDPTPPKAMVNTGATARLRQGGLPPDADTDALRAVPAREYIPVLTGRDVHRGFAQCPFHKGGQERTPSLSVGGPNEELWLCFGCNEGGDIFTMAARMWGLDERSKFPEIKTRLKEILR